MKIIAHRGNIDGPRPKKENSEDYLNTALDAGFDVEADIWFLDNDWWFGHDEPLHLVRSIEPWCRRNVWLHCKNIHAFKELNDIYFTNAHYFWHQKDAYALTSFHYVWTYPNAELLPGNVAVLPENAMYSHENLIECSAICTDYALEFRQEFEIG